MKEMKLINKSTGEVIECTVIQKEVENNFNFQNIWIQDLMGILDLLGGKKIIILNYLLSKMRTTDNTISITYDKIEKELKISRRTIAQTMKILQENNFIKKIQNGLYMINPDVLVKGNSGKKQRLLVEYIQIGDNDEK